METQAKNPGLAGDHNKFLTSSPVKINNLFEDTGVNTLHEIPEKKISVFLVDDDPVYLAAMKHFLSYEMPSLLIRTFETGESFLKQIEQHPDIVILDYYLNSEDASAENGMKILKKIKRINPGIKVVMLSCMDEVKMVVNSIQLGAVDYVSKSERAFMKIKYLVMNLAGHPAEVKYEKFKKRYSIE